MNMDAQAVVKPHGLLLVDKPSGWTSFDVVAKVRGTLAADIGIRSKHLKVGHIGTLDPAATGLLVLAIGKSTKQIPGLIKLDKTYEITMTLGITSSTGDSEGELTKQEGSIVDKVVVTEQIMKFVGEQQQVPPAHSAIKINGQRAYKLARAGKEVVIAPRTITIYSIEGIAGKWPVYTFTARVSSGTYIRSLVADIGAKLGSGAYMSDLRRTSIADFSIANAMSIARSTEAVDIYKNIIPTQLTD